MNLLRLGVLSCAWMLGLSSLSAQIVNKEVQRGGSVQLSASGATTYQWQVSSDGTNYVNIPGGNVQNLGVQVNAPAYYRVVKDGAASSEITQVTLPVIAGAHVSYSSGAQGFIEDKQGRPSSGISIPEDHTKSEPTMNEKLTNWTTEEAVAVSYVHHPVGLVDTKMILKVKKDQLVNFRLKVYIPEDLATPIATTYQTIKGTGADQNVFLAGFDVKEKGYFRYCLECLDGCENLMEISKLEHHSASADASYKSTFLSSPSVHLSQWKTTRTDAPQGAVYDWCYQEVMMPEESDISGTYVMSLGVLDGYMGIQMNGYMPDGHTRHDVIFSMWDRGSTDDNPNLPDNLRANILDKNDLAIAERFANEGTGMKSFMGGHFWECGTFVRFLTNCRKEVATYKVIENGKEVEKQQENTLVSAWFDAQDGKGWQYISTLRLPAQHKRFDSWYSFLENYNYPTGQKQRKGYYRNGYACKSENGVNKWYHFNKVNLHHTDGGDAIGARNDYGHGATDEQMGTNGEKSFIMTTGGFNKPIVGADVVPLNENNSVVENIDLNVLLKRVDQAIAHEKAIMAEKARWEEHQLNKKYWELIDKSSEETSGEGTNGRAAQIIDGDDATYWHSAWQSGSSKFPHHLTVDMKYPNTLDMMEILMSGGQNRFIKSFKLLTSSDNKNWEEVYSNTNTTVENNAFRFKLAQPKECRYFKIVIDGSHSTNEHHVRINEVRVAGTENPIVNEKVALEQLVQQTNELAAKMGTTIDEVVLQTTQENLPGHLYCNAPYTGDTYPADKSTPENGYHLLDNNEDTHLHTDFSGKNSADGLDHYLRVDLGEGQALSNFIFHYVTRNGGNERPSNIEVQGSNDNQNYQLITTLNNLPNTNKTAYKKTITSETAYRYLRFMVKDTYSHSAQGGHKYFSMASFGIGYADLIVKAFEPYEKYTAEITTALKDAKASETAASLDEVRTAKEKLQESYRALQQAYANAFVEEKAVLQGWIDKTNQLMNNCGEVSTHFAPQTLQTTDAKSPLYISSNADQNAGGGAHDGGGVAALLDKNNTTYFHSRWSGNAVNDVHYIQVDLGADLATSDFRFFYVNRQGSGPAPTKMEILGSKDGQTYESIQLLPEEGETLPHYNNADKWYSKNIETLEAYQSLRFAVLESQGSGGNQHGGNYFFALSEFGVELEQTGATTVKPEMTFVSPENITDTYNTLKVARIAYKNATTSEQLVEAVHALQAQYDALALPHAKSLLKGCYDGQQIKETIVGGTNPGFYSVASATAYNKAYAEAAETLNLSSNTSAAVYTEKYEQLQAAAEALTMNQPEADKLYVLRSAHNGYAKDHLVYVNEVNKMQHNATIGRNNPQAVWKLEPVEGNSKQFKMISLHTGEGVENFISYSPTPLNVAAQPMRFESLNTSGQVKMVTSNGSIMHAQQDQDAIVKWADGVNSPSAWYIEEVDLSTVSHQLTVSNYENAGLYLNFNAVIPQGVEAYAATETNATSVKLTPIEGGILPAHTGVIIKAPAAVYDFKYTTENPVATTESKLQGSTYTKYLPGETGMNYYLFGVKKEVVGLYKAWLEYNAEGSRTATAGTDEGGYFKVSANKIYLPLSAVIAPTSALSFIFGETTGIDELSADESEKEIYDMQGRRILKVQQPGLYIVNGKKCYIK